METEVETILGNHLIWARLKVKATVEEIPKSIEVDKRDLSTDSCGLRLWCLSDMPGKLSKKPGPLDSV